MSAEYFQIKSEKSIHLMELAIPEQIDSVEFDIVSERMLASLEGKAGQRWVLDLSNVAYMGSAMLGLMVNVRQQIKSASGTLVLCSLSPKLTEIFHACCLERLFTIVRSQPDALRRATEN